MTHRAISHGGSIPMPRYGRFRCGSPGGAAEPQGTVKARGHVAKTRHDVGPRVIVLVGFILDLATFGFRVDILPQEGLHEDGALGPIHLDPGRGVRARG